MKNLIKILALATAVLVGIAIGINIVVTSPKWVTEEKGLYIISTEVLGNIFEDISEKESHMITSHKYVAYATETKR